MDRRASLSNPAIPIRDLAAATLTKPLDPVDQARGALLGLQRGGRAGGDTSRRAGSSDFVEFGHRGMRGEQRVQRMTGRSPPQLLGESLDDPTILVGTDRPRSGVQVLEQSGQGLQGAGLGMRCLDLRAARRRNARIVR